MLNDNCEVGSRKWYVFLGSSLATLFGGLILILLYKFSKWAVRKCHSRRRKTHSTTAHAQVGADGFASTAMGLDTIGFAKNGSKDNLSNVSTFHPKPKFDINSPRINRVKMWAGTLVSGQTVTGKILVVLVFILSQASLSIYLYETTVFPKRVENCHPWHHNTLRIADFAFNIFFFIYFAISFIAATDKLWFWLGIYSIVEFFTVPPCFLSVILGRSWLGLRCLRALRIMTLPDVLQYINVLTTGSSIRLCQLTTIFFSIWMTGAGLVHLLETSGDPFPADNPFNNSQEITYGEAMYFTIVTMSTVGYGDIGPKTTLGRIFVCVFILCALAIFGSFIPEIADMLFAQNPYGGTYKREAGKRHIIVCGDINLETVSSFLADFLHKDREESDVQVVFLNRSRPDLQLQGLLKRHFIRVNYFVGTVMNPLDLQRMKIHEADACVVLANKRTSEPDTEDAANILRVISIKNYAAHVRVIIQLLQYHNKSFLLNIPSWDWRQGDEVVCLSELKMGFLAQSCMAPGFSTLLANLFSMRSPDAEDDEDENMSSGIVQTETAATSSLWFSDYLRGVSQEIYSEFFSSSFVGLPFKEAAAICMDKLHILLIAVEAQCHLSDHEIEKFLAINPGNTVSIESWTQGFFICDSQEEARRALLYCSACHSDLRDPQCLSQCRCQGSKKKRKHSDKQQNENSFSKSSIRCHSSHIVRNPQHDIDNAMELDTPPVGFVQGKSDRFKKTLEPIQRDNHENSPQLPDNNIAILHTSTSSVISDTSYGAPLARMDSENALDRNPLLFDMTGMFHWCEEQDFDQCMINKHNTKNLRGISEHVVVCIFAEKDSPPCGLRNLVMPLRASNYHRAELKHIILLGNRDFLEQEWPGICNFPKVSVMAGSPMNRATLRMARINRCSACLVISAKCNYRKTDDIYLIDKEVILCTLNIKAMQFDGQITGILSTKSTPQATRRRIRDLALITDKTPRPSRKPSEIHSKRSFSPDQTNMTGTNVASSPPAMSSLIIGNEALMESPYKFPLSNQKLFSSLPSPVPLITELIVDGNVQFIDQDDDDSPDAEVYVTQPYACGTAFTASVLDSLMSTAYFNRNAMTFIRTLITGGATPELEQILSEGIGLRGSPMTDDIEQNRDRCRIGQIPVTDSRFVTALWGDDNSSPKAPASFRQIFLHALHNYGILCFGLYRLRDEGSQSANEKTSSMRLVIGNPEPCYPLLRSDLVFVLIPYQSNNEPQISGNKTAMHDPASKL